MEENFQILIDSRFPGKNQRKLVVSYHLTVISYQFELSFFKPDIEKPRTTKSVVW